MARETILKTTITADGRVIATIPGFPDIEVNPARFPENIQAACRAYGAREKMTNAASLARDPATGASATPAQKRDRVLRVIEAMMAGQWEVRGAGVTSDDIILCDAVAEVLGVDADTARVSVMEMTKQERTALQSDADVGPVFRRLRDAANKTAAVGVDVTALKARIMAKA